MAKNHPKIYNRQTVVNEISREIEHCLKRDRDTAWQKGRVKRLHVYPRLNPIQTGLFWSICDWWGAPGPPPFCISETNNARVMNVHKMIISVQRSPTPSFDLPRPMMTLQ